MGKHFETCIEDGYFSYARRAEAIEREAQLDGLYVIRTSEPEERLSAEDTVRSYKNLAQVERAFRTLKGADLRIRPIHHRGEERVRTHIFLCLLAYYVEWHMRQALSPLLFDDEALPGQQSRRPQAVLARRRYLFGRFEFWRELASPDSIIAITIFVPKDPSLLVIGDDDRTKRVVFSRKHRIRLAPDVAV